MVLNEVALALAGFVLAHAAWNAAELPFGKLIAPFVVVEQSGERELTRFDASNPAAAVKKAREFIDLLGENVDAWAMARQGLVTVEGRELDVLVVEYWARGMPEPSTFMQEIRPPARQRKFKIIGPPFFLQDGEIQEGSLVDDMIDVIMMGLGEHSKASEMWSQWQNEY